MTRLVADAVRDSARRLGEGGVAFGHGTVDATQEAMWLTAHVLGVCWDELMASMAKRITPVRERELRELVAARISTRKPAAYLLHEAWLGTHKFYVDERVIVPRSFIFDICPEVAEFGPVNRSIHKVNEAVAVREFGPLVRIYQRALEGLLGAS